MARTATMHALTSQLLAAFSREAGLSHRGFAFLFPSDVATIPACGCPSCIHIHTAKSQWRRSLIIQFTRRG